MLKGSRDGILRKIQPLSVHGQISLNVHYNDIDDPDGPTALARVGPESTDRDLEPGDRIRLEYVLGAVTSVTRSEADDEPRNHSKPPRS